MLRPFQDWLEKSLWALLIILFPITSMPLIVKLVGSDVVAAPSGILLFILIVFWFIPYILRGGGLPRQVVPFIGFLLVALAATLLSFFLSIPPQKDVDPLRSAFTASITLLIGAGFYIVTSAGLRSDEKIKFAIQCINWSGLAILLWSFTQSAYWFMFNRYPEWMRTIHEFYSVGTLFRQRVVGFALEPSWLAHQLNMLYLPVWLASSIKGHSAHRWRLGKLRFENLLLIGGTIVLFLTLSRVGLFAFLTMVGFWLMRIAFRFVSNMRTRALLRYQGAPKLFKLKNIGITVVVFGGLVMVIFAVLLGIGFFLSRLDHRMANLFNLNIIGQTDPIFYVAEKLSMAARLVYWQSGWQVFNDYPLFGVGLGHAGFFMPEKLSGYAWRLTEVRMLMFRTSNLLNIKSIWVRILAETGMIGFAYFVGWYFVLARTAQSLERQRDLLSKTIGLVGVFVLIGILIEGFSLDTFALPYFWFSFGLLTAASSRPIKLT